MNGQKKWPVKSDLEQLKYLARVFLEVDIAPTIYTPMVVKHPFTDSGFVGIQNDDGDLIMANILEDQEAQRKWKEQYRKNIEKIGTPFALALMITKPFQFAFLKYALPHLSEQDAAQFLTYAWICTEEPNKDRNLSKRQLLSLFRSIDPQKLMDKQEYRRFQELDETVTVYRGVTAYNEKDLKALSWTLNQDTAEWFAKRFGENGTVYEAQISKEHIHALFLSRGESEVIVDPKYLTDLIPIQEQGQDFEMKL